MGLKIGKPQAIFICLTCKDFLSESIKANSTKQCGCPAERMPDVAVIFRNRVYRDVTLNRDGSIEGMVHLGTVKQVLGGFNELEEAWNEDGEHDVAYAALQWFDEN